MAEQPRRIGKFEILGELGRGAMGVVYQARDPAIGRTIALKTLALNILHDTQARERFYREARAAGNLDHPNIVTIHELGEDAGVPFIAMEFVEGTSLDEIAAQDAPWPWDRAAPIIRQILDGLQYAHQNGVVHRDIKPANIRLRPDGRVKIVDFGIARLQASEMTRTGTVLGTVCYMAPEQLEGRQLDGRADLFAVGCILYELLTGRRAFAGETLSDIMARILTGQPVPVTSLAPGCPPAAEAIVNRALEKDRERRYASAEAMAADLAKQPPAAPVGAVRTERVPPSPPRPAAPPGDTVAHDRFASAGRTVLDETQRPAAPPPTASGTWKVALFVGLVLLASVGGALYLNWTSSDTAPPATADSGGAAVPPDGAPTDGTLSLVALPWAEIRGIRETRTGRVVDIGAEFTPVRLKLPGGHYEIQLAHPYLKSELVVPVEIKANEHVQLSPTMPGFDYREHVRAAIK